MFEGDIWFLFLGWMFVLSFGFNGLEYVVYDVWVIDCKMFVGDVFLGSL